MLLKSIRVINFRAFVDTGEIALSPSITVFAGRNNSGKSALFEALRFIRLPNKPFRRGAEDAGSGQSRVEAKIVLSGQEIKSALKTRTGGDRITIPVDQPGLASPQEFIDSYFSRDKIEMTFARSANGQLASIISPSHQIFSQREAVSHLLVKIDSDGNFLNDKNTFFSKSDTIPGLLSSYIDRSIFVFNAQRTVGTIEKFGKAVFLDPLASNLPNALNALQGGRPRDFQRFKRYVQTVLPDVSNVSVEPANEEAIDIRIWSAGTDQKSGELSISLSDCGTGVGQVLAIIYAAMTNRPAIIAIDEPSSFLHPGATKKLLGVLNELENQYIFATHSSDIISKGESGIIYSLSRSEGTVRHEAVNTKNIPQVRSMLQELGVALTDVMGFDEVIWVEGPTEAEAFPKLLIADRSKSIPSFIAMKNTGDFQKKKSKISLIFEIYRKMSSSSAILPSKVRFGFDREALTDSQMEDIKREASGDAHFTDRRLFENYILHADSIHKVISAELKDVNAPSLADVDKWLADSKTKCRQSN